MTFLTG